MSIEARAEIERLIAAGHGPTAIAARLNAEQVPTPSGRGRWYPETVQRHLNPAGHAAYMRAYRARLRDGHVPRQQRSRW